MSLDETALEAAAKDGTVDLERWGAMVEPLLDRLDHIVYNVFPMPKPVPEDPSLFCHYRSTTSLQPSSHSQDSNYISSSSNKENVFSPGLRTPPRPTVSVAAYTSASAERIPNSQPLSSSGSSDNYLPAPLMLLLSSIRSTMRSYFASKPPHTVQRLAELILRPNVHYRTLPAYLRAVDRVITVTSSADSFPLQIRANISQLNGLMNGGMLNHSIGDDESLGGALLTPIPWLNNTTSFENSTISPLNQGLEPIHEPMPPVSSHGVQQSDQQDTEMSLISVPSESQIFPSTPTKAGENEACTDLASLPPEDLDETPHARGPPVIGVEDMGLQNGKGVEMPLSDAGSSVGQSTAQNGQEQGQSSQDKGKAEMDNDGDIILEDAKEERGRETVSVVAADKAGTTKNSAEQGVEQANG